MDTWSLPRQRIVTINDNAGLLFEFRRQSDGSYVAEDAPVSRPSTTAGGIGDIRVTDATLMLGTDLEIPGGLVHVDPKVCPSGEAALLSFAEALRRGAQQALDIDPGELTVGIQPRLVSEQQTSLIYLADTLENGAGYAAELGQGLVKDVMDGVVTSVAESWLHDDHRGCDSSCPDCLRSWDNQRVHGKLDWHLALDLAHLLRGGPLPPDGWHARARPYAERFVRAFKPFENLSLIEVGGVPAIKSDSAVALVGHPLWPRNGPVQSPLQMQAQAEAVQHGPSFWTDARELAGRPDTVWLQLTSL